MTSFEKVRPDKLDDVLALYRQHKTTLGFMPDGAFEEHANQGTLIEARDGARLVGYILYRLVKFDATIAHLCVDTNSRGMGIARGLLDKLIASVPERIERIKLSCRRDFPAHSSWQHLGFVARAERQGRGDPPMVLTEFTLDLRKPTLISASMTSTPRAGAGEDHVAIDAQLFYDLASAQERCHLETRFYVESWEQEGIHIHLSDETLNEITRNPSELERQRLRALAEPMLRLRDHPNRFAAILGRLNSIFGTGTRDSEHSDRRQLAHAIAGDVGYFVTRDGEILGWADRIHDEFGVRIVRPSLLLSAVDEFRNPARYEAVRLSGTALLQSHLTTFDVTAVGAILARRTRLSPRRHEDHIARLLEAKATAFVTIHNESGIQGALAITTDQDRLLSTVDLLCVAPSPISHAIHSSLLQNAIERAHQLRSRALLLPVRDDVERDPHAESDLGFLESTDGSVKFLPTGILSFSDVSSIDPADASLSPLHSLLSSGQRDAVARAIWPAQLDDDEIPSFLVPIRPTWAMNLFDHRLAAGDLFGAPVNLMLRSRNIYYRSPANSAGLSPPARLIWYVSEHIGEVRAISMLSSLDEGPASAMYRRHRRSGVYQWRDVREKAGDDAQAPISVLEFGPTLLLPKPVPFRRVQNLLSECGSRENQIASPVRVRAEFFRALWNEAT